MSGDADTEPSALQRERTLAIVLGASEWPSCPDFHAAPSFRRSAYEIADYFYDRHGLNLPQRNLKVLVDSFDDAPEILRQMRGFVRSRRDDLDRLDKSATDLLVYYVGHGGFADSDAFFLSIRSTDEDDPLATSITAESLGRFIREAASGLRAYLVLDCCFAASATKVFMSAGPLGVAGEQLRDALPPQGDVHAIKAGKLPAYGTALLCASGPREPAKAPPDLPYTMFTGGLLEVLRHGDPASPAWLSLDDMQRLVRARLESQFANKAVLPQVHAPQQRMGRVDLVPLFRNPAVPIPEHLWSQPTQALQAPDGGQRSAASSKSPLPDFTSAQSRPDSPPEAIAHQDDQASKPVPPSTAWRWRKLIWSLPIIAIIGGSWRLLPLPLPSPAPKVAQAQIEGVGVRIVSVQRSREQGVTFINLDYAVTTEADFSRHDPVRFVRLISNGVGLTPVWTSTSAIDLPPHSRQDILAKFPPPVGSDTTITFRFGNRSYVDLQGRMSD